MYSRRFSIWMIPAFSLRFCPPCSFMRSATVFPHGCTVAGSFLRISLSGLCLDTTPFSSPLSEAVCAAAGPVCGLLWAALCSQIPGEWWERCRDVSLYFSVCNLLPAQPLDGGRILHALCRNRKAVHIITVCTGVICLVSAALTRRWGFALPAVCILAAQLRALRRGGFPWPGAPSATLVPEIQRESARSRFASGHGKTED